MRRVMRWLRHLLALAGRKEEHRGLEVNHVHVGSGDWSDGPEKEKKRWSFAKQRQSGAGGGARSSAPDAVAPIPTVGEWSQLARRPREDARARERRAAILIQKTFRGYLARRALRALRSLVKIQALVRGYLVRKQATMTLHRLQTLMRLQADSIAVKNASYRKSMEQEERIYARHVQVKPLATAPVHRRMRSDSSDSIYELRSPRVVEMDTCHLRSRSSRITSRYNPADSLPEYHRHAAPTPSCSPLPGSKHQPARLSFRQSARERDPRVSKTAQSTPRLASPHDSSSPAKSVEHSLAGTPRRRATQRDRDALVSPRFMAGTASSAARTRCHSAPRQRQTTDAEQAPRTSVYREGAPRRSCSHAHGGVFCFQCSEATRTAGFSGINVSDEMGATDYYLDSFW